MIKFDTKHEAEEYVKSHPMMLKDLEPIYQRDRDVQLAAVRSNGYALEYCTDEFKAIEALVREAMKTAPEIVKYAAPDLAEEICKNYIMIADKLGDTIADTLNKLDIKITDFAEKNGCEVANLTWHIPPENIEFILNAESTSAFVKDFNEFAHRLEKDGLVQILASNHNNDPSIAYSDIAKEIINQFEKAADTLSSVEKGMKKLKSSYERE